MSTQSSPANARRPLDQPAFEAAATLHERFLRRAGGQRAILKFVEAPGVDGRRRMLNDVDFTGANLQGAVLAGSHMERALLFCANLQGADLRATNLSRADLRGARLAGAALSGAVLDEADMRAAYIAYAGVDGSLTALPSAGAGAPASSPDAPQGADFTDCVMRGVRLCWANLKGANFSGALLEQSDFTGAKTTGAIFRDTVLSNVRLDRLDLTAEQFRGCVLEPDAAARGRAAQLRRGLERSAEWVESGGRRGAPVVIDGEDLRPLASFFRGRVLTALSARRARAIGLDFSGSQLQAAQFDNADLRGAIFDGADLRGASFQGAKLSHARFVGADLSALTLPNGRALPCRFDNAALNRTDFSHTVRVPANEG